MLQIELMNRNKVLKPNYSGGQMHWKWLCCLQSSSGIGWKKMRHYIKKNNVIIFRTNRKVIQLES